MIIAARRPIASLAPPISASAKMSPPNSRLEPGDVDVGAELLDLLAVGGELLTGAVGEVDLARTRSSRCARSGARPRRRTGSRPRRRGSSARPRRTGPPSPAAPAASSTPWSAAKTICACTWRLRKLDFSSRSNASWLSVPGSLNSVLNAPFRLLAERERRDEQDDPTAEHPTAAAVREAREALQHGGTSLSRGRPRYAAGPRARPGLAPSVQRHVGVLQSRRDGVPVALPQVPAAAVRGAGRPGPRHARRCATRCATAASATRTSSPGPRGTGKTTTARILAKALNCTEPRATTASRAACARTASRSPTARSLDLIELDAASNSGVDEMRDLHRAGRVPRRRRRARRCTSSTRCTCSAAASNALLKTLEEPPAHVVFVLATTDPQKVLPTIRSRTQHFEFTLYTVDELAAAPRRRARQGGRRGRPRRARAHRPRRRRVDARLAVAARPGARATVPLDVEQVGALFGGAPFDGRARGARGGRRRGRRRRARRRCASCSTPGTSRAALAEDLLAHAARRVPPHVGAGRVRVDVARGRRRRGSPRSARRSGNADARAHARDARAGGRRHARHRRRRPAARARDRAGAPGPSRGGHAAAGARRPRRPARTWRGAGGGTPAAAPAPSPEPAPRRAPAPAPAAVGSQRPLVRRARAADRAAAAGAERARRNRRRAATAPTPAPAPAPRRGRAAPATVDLDDVIVAWADDPAGVAAGDACRGAGGAADRGRRRRHRVRRAARAVRRRRCRASRRKPTTIRAALSRLGSAAQMRVQAASPHDGFDAVAGAATRGRVGAAATDEEPPTRGRASTSPSWSTAPAGCRR